MPTFVSGGFVCSMHCGFSREYVEGVGHYPPLPLDEPCPRCVPWGDLCPEWAESSGWASTRCMRRRGHEGAHLSDFLGYDRRSWVVDCS